MLPPILNRLHWAQGYLLDEILEFLLVDLPDALLHRRVLPVHDAAQRRVATIEHLVRQVAERRQLQDVLLEELLVRDRVRQSA